MFIREVVIVATATAMVAGSGLINEQDNLNTALAQEKVYLNTEKMLKSTQSDFETDFQQEQGDLGTSMTTDQHDSETDIVQEQVDLTAGLMPLNNSGLMRKSDKKSVTNHLKTRADRKKSCYPTSSCTHAGGHCFNSGGTCNGTVDSYGCLGGKHCICCIPDTNTTLDSCPVCHEATCSPQLTSPADTLPPNATSAIQTTTATATDTTVAPTVVSDSTSAIQTTTAPDTDPTIGPTTTTPACVSPWVTLGSSGCLFFSQHKLDWDSARSFCQNSTGDLGIFDSESKIIDLNNYFSNASISKSFWAGATHRSGSWLWLNNNTITTENWYPTQPDYEERVNSCVNVRYRSSDYKLLVDWGCSNNNYFVCEK